MTNGCTKEHSSPGRCHRPAALGKGKIQPRCEVGVVRSKSAEERRCGRPLDRRRPGSHARSRHVDVVMFQVPHKFQGLNTGIIVERWNLVFRELTSIEQEPPDKVIRRPSPGLRGHQRNLHE